MFTYFYRNPRILILANVLIVVTGLLSVYALPRMEDPQLTPRAATITTLLPGADAERVEALVTDKIEQELKEIEEIKEVNSVSRAGVSFIAVELKDATTKSEAPQIWSRIRDKADDARLKLPADASRPEFQRLDIKAYSMILAVTWTADSPVRYGVLKRLAKELKESLDAVDGTEKTDYFGEPSEEVVVSIDPQTAAALGLRPEEISRTILARDSKSSAGQLRSPSDDLLVEVDGEIDTVAELSQIPIRFSQSGSVVQLSDISTIDRTVRLPLSSQVLASGSPAVAVSAYVQSSMRLDHWHQSVMPVIDDFRSKLPPGVQLEIVFDQDHFVSARMSLLVSNLLYGIIAVFVSNLLILGWRGTWIVSIGLPLSVLSVLFIMYLADIPVHQMSITGLIIAMGLVVDNAIVIVDEVNARLRSGLDPVDAVKKTCRHLAPPLAGATLTTVISFAPIALMPGPSGEFVGAIATVAIAAVSMSYLLALTIVAAMSGLALKGSSHAGNWFASGISIRWVERFYLWGLTQIFRFPAVGVTLAIVAPILGFATFPKLREQFFPPADRSQFHIEFELSGNGSILETEVIAKRIRERLLQRADIRAVTWFLGESAPPFYYNIIPDHKNTPRFGQAIVDCANGTAVRHCIAEVQSILDHEFPSVAAVAMQLEQGPPFSAPIEVQLFGPNSDVLRSLGEQVRLVLAATPQVIQTRSDFSESLPKVAFAINQEQARLVGLENTAIAGELNSMLEGVTGGSILEDSEELPIRVRIAERDRGDLERIAGIDLVSASANSAGDVLTSGFASIPFNSISTPRLIQERGAVNRQNGRRMNEVQAFIPAGVLPAVVQADFERRLRESGFDLPLGYSLQFAGAEAERNDALGNLVVNGIILLVTMITVLVVSTQSFRLTGLLFSVALLAVGSGLGSLYLADLNWGFMSVVGIMGMIGIAVNDSIVVIASLGELSNDEVIDARRMATQVSANTRHVLATSVTTVAGFTPLFLGGGEFWPPVAVAISGGVMAATLLALLYVPCMYRLVYRNRWLIGKTVNVVY